MSRVPSILVRFVGFTFTGVGAYLALMVLGTALSSEPTPAYPLAASLMAGLVAYHLVYRGGYARLRDRLG